MKRFRDNSNGGMHLLYSQRTPYLLIPHISLCGEGSLMVISNRASVVVRLDAYLPNVRGQHKYSGALESA
jgi:hypothetical protein